MFTVEVKVADRWLEWDRFEFESSVRAAKKRLAEFGHPTTRTRVREV